MTSDKKLGYYLYLLIKNLYAIRLRLRPLNQNNDW